MKKLIIIRHGACGSDDRLSNEGRRQISDLTHLLQNEIFNASVCILTSPTDRTYESADIIGSFFKVSPEKNDCLWDDNHHRGDHKKTLELIRLKPNFEVIVLVTHMDFAVFFPEFFGKEELQTQITPKRVGYGQALIIDCNTKEVNLLKC